MSEIIIYTTTDGKASVSLFARDGDVWMNQNQLAELFDTSKQNIGQHINNILEEKELQENSVVKNYFTTAADGKKYDVTFYSLSMILAIGFRVRSKRDLAELYVLPVDELEKPFLHKSMLKKYRKNIDSNFYFDEDLNVLR